MVGCKITVKQEVEIKPGDVITLRDDYKDGVDRDTDYLFLGNSVAAKMLFALVRPGLVMEDDEYLIVAISGKERGRIYRDNLSDVVVKAEKLG